MRLPPPSWRTPLLLMVLLGVHSLFGPWIEKARVLLLGTLVVPWTWIQDRDDSAPEASADPLDRVRDAGREEFNDHFEVLDHDASRGFLIVGAGHDDGVKRGALATVPEGCAGVVDLVAAHLCRVRLLGAEGSKLLVQVQGPARKLPGEVEALVGTVEGGRDGARVSDAFLPECFRRGDPLVTVDGSWPVGVVETEGVRPKVRLAVSPEGRSRLRIAGARPREVREPLFADREARMLLDGIGVRGQGLARMTDPGGVLPGAAVHAGGRLLGQVGVVAGSALLIQPPGAGGPAFPVLVFPRDADRQAGTAAAFTRDGQDLRLTPADAAGPVPAGPVDVYTAGGQELVPGGLLVAAGRSDGRSLLPDPAVAPPATVQVAVFRFADELRFLREQRR